MNISFIIPVYNCKDYLSACVDSIRSSGVPDYEILLIDDGSTDDSGVLCEELAARFPELRVIHQANGGASAARNRGLREAKGEKILFFDADDSVDAAAVGRILTDPRCEAADLTVFGMTFDYYRKGKCYRQDALFYPGDRILRKQDWGSALAELYVCNSLSPLWNKVFKREILLRHGLELNRELFLYEDFDFVLRYMQHCDSVWNVPEAVYHYRQAEDEGNAKRRLARIESLPVFLKTIEESLSCLRSGNPFIREAEAQKILQQLYLVLAREKIAVSDLSGIRKICRDFSLWAQGHELPVAATVFRRRLQEEKALQLLLASKKSHIRHTIAVWVKSHRK